MFCKIYQGIVHIPDVPLAQLFFSFWEVSLSGGLPAIMCVFKQKKRNAGPCRGPGYTLGQSLARPKAGRKNFFRGFWLALGGFGWQVGVGKSGGWVWAL